MTVIGGPVPMVHTNRAAVQRATAAYRQQPRSRIVTGFPGGQAVEVARQLVTSGTTITDLRDLAVVFREAETGALPIDALPAAVRELTRFDGIADFWVKKAQDDPFGLLGWLTGLLALVIAVIALHQGSCEASPPPLAPAQVEPVITEVAAQYADAE